jgi:uncharacterized coiled-coil DUF342 family protein
VNTEIKKFEKQCWNHQTNQVDSKKFVQLIVGECAKLLEEMPRYYKQQSDRQIERDTIFDCIRTIKEHFEVD